MFVLKDKRRKEKTIKYCVFLHIFQSLDGLIQCSAIWLLSNRAWSLGFRKIVHEVGFYLIDTISITSY